MRRAVPFVTYLLATAAPAGLRAQQAAIPTPESVLGFEVGADFRLATYDESLDYFRRLAAASDRIRLVEVGRTSEQRRWYFALISLSLIHISEPTRPY